MLKILQARLQQYVNCEFPDVQVRFIKGRGTSNQIAIVCCSIKKGESSRKASMSALFIMPKPLCGPQQTVEVSLRDGNTRIPDLPFLRNLYAGQEAMVRTGDGTTDWFQIGHRVCQGCILSPCLFKLYIEYVMRNAELDDAQAGIKIAERNSNTLRYADDTTLMSESVITF